MFRFLVICGCLLAVAQAGVIGGGLLAATAPAAVAVQPGAAALPLSAATVALPTIATSSSNVIRGPVATAALAPTLLAPGLTTALAPGLTTALAPGLTTALAGPALTAGLASPLGLNGLALNGLGAVKVL
ncbi:cuticular protein CPF2 isoform X2 [Ptiloglossa arizonensis]|uniref:cuticular protein CPF2 isoform X2 n=1 Tax=Ptiloglossa arizonensis TaxID=3350558 RepID=UPI003FA0112A